MKKRIVGTVLVLVFALAAITAPFAQAAPSDAALAPVYKAYYDVLKAATDEYGIGENPKPFTHGDGEVLVGVLFARLVYFGDSALPYLVFTYDWGYAPGHYVIEAVVYGYEDGTAELCFAGTVGGHGSSVSIVRSTDSKAYLKSDYTGGFYDDGDPGYEEYYTVTNGKWGSVPASGVFSIDTQALNAVDAASVRALLAQLQPLQPKPQTAKPTASTVYLNGSAIAFEAYIISGNNYFKLRDIGFVLNGTQKQFAGGYDNVTKSITLVTGQPYTPEGGEMVLGDGKAKTANPTPSVIYLDGKPLDFTVYNIGGNNFFMLRDLMEALDIFGEYDNATKAISLDTSKGYVGE